MNTTETQIELQSYYTKMYAYVDMNICHKNKLYSDAIKLHLLK